MKYEWENIEELLIKQNINYCKKVLQTLVYKDKIYEKLASNEI